MTASFIQANTNGRLHRGDEPSLAPLNRGFLFGDAIYEVWRTYGGVVFAWEEHWRRLERSAKALYFNLPWSAAEIFAEIRRTVAAFRTALQTLDTTLKRADTLMGQLSKEVAPELRATLEQARKTLRSADQALSSDSPMQGDLRETLNEVTKAAETVRSLADYLERHPESLIRGRREGSDKR